MTDREKVIMGLKCLASAADCCSDCPYYRFDCTQKIAQDVLELLKEQETVILCKDCKFWRENTEFCVLWSNVCLAQHVPPDWYCAGGERR